MQRESEHFGENIWQNTTYWWYEGLEQRVRAGSMPAEDIKETHEIQQNHEIDLCKKDL